VLRVYWHVFDQRIHGRAGSALRNAARPPASRFFFENDSSVALNV
jgi:hypothetical protein